MRRLPFVLLLAAAACGDDGGNNPRPDGGDDAGADAPANGAVTLTVKLNGAAVAGVRVHFQGPDSSLIASADTDATGVASAVMPSGGFVSTINPFTPAPGQVAQQEVLTYTNVQPGDALEVSSVDPPSSAGTVTVNAATDSDAAVTDYVFWSPCYQGDPTPNPTISMTVATNCQPTTDVVVASLDSAGEIVHWVYAAAVSTAATIDLTGSAFTQTPIDRTYTFTNLSNYGEIDAGLELLSPAGRVIEATFGDFNVTTLSEPYKLPMWANAGEVSHFGEAAEFSANIYGHWGALAAGELTIDAGARRLKQATVGATFDASSKKLSWTEAATGVVGDFKVGELDISRNNGANRIRWRLLTSNATAGEVTFPTLPVETTDFNPGAGDTVSPTAVVGKVTGGYEAIRKVFFTLDDPSQIPTLSTSGDLAIQIVFEQAAGLQRMLNLFVPSRRSPARWKQRW